MNEHLHTYINDHLAGAHGALQLLERLGEECADAGLKAFFAGLRQDISADREELRGLLHKLGGEESSLRNAGAWLLEKLSRVKLKVGEEDRDLGLLQALESLTLGIAGKRSLWRTLSLLATREAALLSLDYPRLLARAEEQLERVETKYLEIVPSVLGDR